MKNRIASLFLVFALLMSLCTFAVARDNRINVQSSGAERFTDVPTSHWAYDYINKVVGSGLFNGKTATTFEPSSAMTRSQFVMVMARMEGRSDLEGVETQTIFPDVSTTRRAAGPIKWATDEGFVNGFGDGTFKPDSPINRGQFAALIHRYIIAKRYVNLHVVDPEPAQFTDAASVSTAFTSDVEYARVHGLLTGYSDGTVRASYPITRAAIAAILARFLDLVTESGYTPLLDGPVIDDGKTDDGKTDDGNTTSTDVPTSYDDIKLTVKNEKYGTTSITVTRDGKTVAGDDLQPGDRVTISHVPDSGYGVSIRVRDANGKSVTKHTSGNSTWFEAPKNLPVTITVTYSKTSGGGSGGGGSSSSSGGSSSGGGSSGGGGQENPPVVTKTTYYLLTQAQVVPAAHGTVFLANAQPTQTTTAPTNLSTAMKALFSKEFESTEQPNLTSYVVFVPEDGYELDATTISVTKPVTGADGQTTTENVTYVGPTQMNIANGLNVWYLSFTERGNTNSSQDPSRTPDVRVTAGFKAISQPGPGPSADEVTWTITPNVIGGFVEVSETAFANDKAQVTADNLSTSTFKVKKGEPMTVYVAVSPDTANKFVPGNPNLTRTDNGAVVTIPATSVRENASKTLYIYTITISNIQENTTTVLEGGFEADPLSNYDVTVLDAKYFNGTNTVTPPDGVVLLKPYVEVPTARANTDVTVYVPVTKGYRVHEITVTGASGKAYNATLSSAEDADPLEYVFKMPNESVTVEVSFEAIPDPDLTYTVNVDFDGEGTMTLNIGGEDVKFDGDRTYTRTMKTSEYVALYGDKFADQALPIYVGAAPIPANGYKYDERNSLNNIDPNSTKEEPDDVLTPGTTLNLKVVFVRERSFGYNLTVIGKGTVVVDFNGKSQAPFTNNTDGMATTSHSEFIEGATSVNVSVSEADAGDGYKPFDSDVLINDTSVKLEADYAMSEGMVDIVVAFLRADAKPTAFTVELANNPNGSVLVRAENGRFVEGALPDDATAENNLKSGKTSETISKTTTYYAYDGTIITLTPQPATGYKVNKIGVKGNDNIADELPSKGFSYTLKPKAQSADNVLTVTFAKFEQYRARVQAPYSPNGTLTIGDVHSYSREIEGARTLQDVLYSLNNGQKAGKDTFTVKELNNIENNIASSFGNINKILGVYLNTPNEGKTPAKDLEQTLQDSVAATLTENLSAMVEAQKNEMVKPANGQESELQKQVNKGISDALSAKASTVTPIDVTLDNDTKATIVKQILESADAKFRTAYDNGDIGFDDFQVTATVTPLLLASEERGIEKAAGKSVETQLQSFITDYLLNYLEIDVPSSVEAKISVEAEHKTNVGVVIDISAQALFEPNRLPTIGANGTFNDYVNPAGSEKGKLSTWLKTVATVTLNSSNATLNTEFNNAVKPQTDVFSLAKIGANIDESPINDALTQVDANIESAWNEKWDTEDRNSLVTLENGKAVLTVDMAQVLTKDMLDTVVEGKSDDPNNNGVLDDLLTTLTDKVNSLGGKEKATATKAAVLNIYRDFIVFNAGDNNNLIALKTKGDKTNVIGKVTSEGNLELTLDFDAIFRDVKALDDQTSFEKLIDLATALRDGLSTDIRNNSTNNETAQSVLAGLIKGQISKKGELIATKWGTPISSNGKNGRPMTEVEKQELANLTAELLMQPLNVTLDNAWKNFEDKGYRSVSMSFNVDEGRFPELVTALKTFQGSTFGDDIRAGFKVDQKLDVDD